VSKIRYHSVRSRALKAANFSGEPPNP
jgi:hypothetical protein